MGMMERVRKRKADGFKEFVASMESSAPNSRTQILTVGFLEDPVYMTYVLKNIRTFEDFLNLSSDDICKVLSGQDQLIRILSKCLHPPDDKKLRELQSAIPHLMGRLRDELSLLKEVSDQEKEAAAVHILKLVRKFQAEERIQGFTWILPPENIYTSKRFEDGECKIYFENHSLAAQGFVLKGKRSGEWKHFYDNGKVFAEGAYVNGLKIGNWVFFYGNGKKRAQGNFSDDEKQGIWKEWDRLGKETEKKFSEHSNKAT